MNARHFSALAAVATVLAANSPVHAATQSVDRFGKPGVIVCGKSATGATIEAVHVDKIIFMLTNTTVNLQATHPEDQEELNAIPRGVELDIKVLDNPKRIADLRGKVLSFIGAVDLPTYRQFVKIIDVDYAVVCPAATPS
ncbi:MAG: hypothetical protein J0L57_07475 [Burkholderiales bacterium]|nr:hypothetical protein [Burkholderiales bacterium]